MIEQSANRRSPESKEADYANIASLFNTNVPIRPIETRYRKYLMRSRLEARWAVVFDNLGISWQYEHEGYHLPTGAKYLPDFYLPQTKTYVEVKPAILKCQRKRVGVVHEKKYSPLAIYGGPAIPYSMATDRHFDCVMIWLPSLERNRGVPISQLLFEFGGTAYQLIDRGIPIYLASDRAEVVDAVKAAVKQMGGTLAGATVKQSERDAACAFFTPHADQHKLIEASFHLKKNGLMLMGGLHEYEAELFEASAPFASTLVDESKLFECLTGKQDFRPKDLRRALAAGTAERFE